MANNNGNGNYSEDEPVIVGVRNPKQEGQVVDIELEINAGSENINGSEGNDFVSDLDTSASRRTSLPPGPRSTGGTSVISFASAASSTGSSVRQRRLPPPPPMSDRKRRRPNDDDLLSTDSRTSHIEADQMSIVSLISNHEDTQVNHRVLEAERRRIKSIRPEPERYIMTYDSLVLGRHIEPQQEDAYVDTTYCSRSVLEQLMSVKYKVRQAGTSDFRTVQSKMSNHGGGKLFHHSEAVIFANIDAVFNKCITAPKDLKTGEPILGPNEVLYVVDIEGAPGGGVEYVLTRKKWEAKVYSFSSTRDDAPNYSLKGEGHYCPESMEQWLGHSNERGDGNIMNPEFVNKFAAHVRKTSDRGAHVVLASGGIKGSTIDEDRKELLLKNVAAAEAFIGLRCLREGGNFILKLYDMFTNFTVGIVYLLYRTFDEVTIYRPESCTYGSAERYVVCIGYRSSKASRCVTSFLENCIQTEYMSRPSAYSHEDKAEIMTLVQSEVIRDTEHFYDYVYNMNQEIGEIQLRETKEIVNSIASDDIPHLISAHKERILSKCWKVWGLPQELPQNLKYDELDAAATARKLLRPYSEYDLNDAERIGEVELVHETLQQVNCPREWHYVHVGRDRGFYLSKGKDNVYRYAEGTWKLVSDDMQIAANTLVYGDIVDEISQYEGKQIVKSGLHIIDALVLGGKDIRSLPYVERNEYCLKFAASMNKVMADKILLVRSKHPKLLNTIGDSFRAVHRRQVLGRGDLKKKPLVPVDGAKYNMVVPEYALTGYLLLKTTKPNNAACDFLSTLQNRIYFRLKDDSNMDPHAPVVPGPPLHRRSRVEAAALVNHLQQNSGTRK